MDSAQHNGSEIPRILWIVGTPIIFCIGVTGNIITILVLTSKNQRKSSTTVYLTILAIADMLVLIISLPRWWIIYMFEMDIRHINNIMCKLHWFLTYFDSGVSISILVTVTIERIISTMKPHRMKTMCTVKSALLISATIILILIIINAHVLFGLKLFYKEVPTETQENINDLTDLSQSQLLNNCSTSTTTGSNCSSQILENITSTSGDEPATFKPNRMVKMCWYSDQNYGKFYKGPFQILIMLLYNIFPEIFFFIGGMTIVRTLAISQTRVAPDAERGVRNHRNVETDSNSRQITKSLLLVNIVFFICTTPIFIFLLGRSVWVDAEKGMTETQEIIWAFCNIMFYTNHAVNFILYFLSGKRFRKRVLAMLCFRKYFNDNSTVRDTTV